jgi:hypothetical protein
MKSNSKSRKVVRALRLSGAASGKGRSLAVVFSDEGAKKATEKSAEQDGEEGVTTIAGRGVFSPICETEASSYQWFQEVNYTNEVVCIHTSRRRNEDVVRAMFGEPVATRTYSKKRR